MENTWKLLKSAPPTAIFGIVVIATYIFVALFAPVLTPYGESEIVGSAYELWGEGYVLGTDNLGRDMLTRLIYGARNTIGIAFATTVLSFLIGGVFGLMATALGGWVDQLLGRIVDVLMAIPTLIFALLLLTILGTDMIVLILVIAILDSTRVFRLARAVSMNIAWSFAEKCSAAVAAGLIGLLLELVGYEPGARYCRIRCRRWSPNSGCVSVSCSCSSVRSASSGSACSRRRRTGAAWCAITRP
jgi:ABC-type Fe3+ transport system permease subunit